MEVAAPALDQLVRGLESGSGGVFLLKHLRYLAEHPGERGAQLPLCERKLVVLLKALVELYCLHLVAEPALEFEVYLVRRTVDLQDKILPVFEPEYALLPLSGVRGGLRVFLIQALLLFHLNEPEPLADLGLLLSR